MCDGRGRGRKDCFRAEDITGEAGGREGTEKGEENRETEGEKSGRSQLLLPVGFFGGEGREKVTELQL